WLRARGLDVDLAVHRAAPGRRRAPGLPLPGEEAAADPGHGLSPAGPLRLSVDEAGAGVRLDRWLSSRVPELSRARLQALIGEGAVLLDGRSARPSSRLRPGQAVEVRI